MNPLKRLSHKGAHNVMENLTFNFETKIGATMLSNIFIDTFLPQANGEFVKIYIYLLRCASGNMPLSVSRIADIFNNTEADVIRALKYWEKMNILKLDFNGSQLVNVTFLDFPEVNNGAAENVIRVTSHILDESAVTVSTVTETSTLSSAEFAVSNATVPAPASSKLVNGKIPAYSTAQLKSFKEKDEIAELLFVVSTYLEKTLSATEMNAILFFYDELKFPANLIEYLIEYCVSKGSKSIHYIQKVALAWADEGISTREQAMSATNTYNKNVFAVFNEFKIKGRSPIKSEVDYINKWVNDYAFTLDIVKEACQRTVLQTSKPDFRYCDGILTGWYNNKVHHLSDIEQLDTAFKKKKIEEKAIAANNRTAYTNSVNKNKFNNFQQRTYDYGKLEKELLHIQ